MTSSPVPQPSRPEPPMAPLSKKVIAWVAAGIITATVAVVLLLWWAGTRGLEGEKLVTARFDALRTGLSIGLAGGGLFVLYLAWRRQHSTEIGLAQKQQDQADVARAYALQERTALASEADAAARRITDLYTKAVEQLGSEKAPVRLGGLYALERLAQDHVEQRQTIVNVLCAYLRMPYALPRDPPADYVDYDDKRTTAHRECTQEREVRLAAQRILAHHLRPGNDADDPVETFWADIELDLTSATLINFNLARCTTLNAQFDRATFTGTARFSYTTFTGDAGFNHATFKHDVRFDQATFTGYARFNDTTFEDYAWFNDATFEGGATFNEATFMGGTQFSLATFTGNAGFNYATFKRDAHFYQATFTNHTDFEGAAFEGGATFDQATLPNTRYTSGGENRDPWIDFAAARFVERFVSRPGEEASNGGEAG